MRGKRVRHKTWLNVRVVLLLMLVMAVVSIAGVCERARGLLCTRIKTAKILLCALLVRIEYWWIRRMVDGERVMSRHGMGVRISVGVREGLRVRRRAVIFVKRRCIVFVFALIMCGARQRRVGARPRHVLRGFILY